MPASESESGGVFEVERIRRLVELMKEHDLSEIDLRESEQRIRICRGGQQPQMVAAQPAVPQAAPAPQPAPAPSAPAAEEDDESITYITCPMVGTFYSKPNPNAESFVKVGDHVDPETTVCIVEAMKMFNEIPAQVRGKIVAVLVDDEEPVDHGKRLFKIDTSG